MEGHKAQTNNALISVQLAVDTLTDCTVNKRKVIFYPQTVPPSLLTEALTQSIPPSFPVFTTALFPHSKVPANLLNKLIHKL